MRRSVSVREWRPASQPGGAMWFIPHRGQAGCLSRASVIRRGGLEQNALVHFLSFLLLRLPPKSPLAYFLKFCISCLSSLPSFTLTCFLQCLWKWPFKNAPLILSVLCFGRSSPSTALTIKTTVLDPQCPACLAPPTSCPSPRPRSRRLSTLSYSELCHIPWPC